MIQVVNLTYEYPGTKVLDNISFDVPVASVTALLGPNGSGKTTLLECMAGLKKPYKGRVLIDGIDVTENPRFCHTMLGYLSGYSGLYGNLTVKQNLIYFANAYKIPKSRINDRIHEIAKRLNIEDKLSVKADNLSRGQRQLLCFGLSVLHKPLVLLLNKPMAGLDLEARFFMQDMLRELHQQGMTLFISFQLPRELYHFADNLLILKNGDLIPHNISAGVANEEKIIKVQLYEVNNSIAEILSSFSTVSNIVINYKTITFTFNGTNENQFEILQAFIKESLPVAEFGIISESIEEQYLQLMKSAD